MSPGVVYIKSDKGREEIATRRHKLPAKLRAILIMVDGQRRVKDLMAGSRPVAMEVGPALAELEAQGLIVRTGTVAPAVAANDPAPAPAPTPAAAAPDFKAARATAVRLIQEAMGRDAGSFASRLERCATGEELLAQAERYAIVLGSVRNKVLGDGFLRQVRAALGAD